MDLLMIHWPFLSRPCLGFQICFTPPMFGGQCHHHQHQKKNSQTFSSYSWWFQPPLKNMSQNGFISPSRCENTKHLSCHHLVFCFQISDRFDAASDLHAAKVSGDKLLPGSWFHRLRAKHQDFSAASKLPPTTSLRRLLGPGVANPLKIYQM